MQLSPDEILVNMDVVFEDGVDTQEAIDEIEGRIQHAVPAATRIFIEPERVQ